MLIFFNESHARIEEWGELVDIRYSSSFAKPNVPAHREPPHCILSDSVRTKRAAMRCSVMILIQASSAAMCSGMVAVPKIHPHKEEAWMNFYTQQHKHYCGIDLHARAMYVCILDQHGTKLVHKNLP